MTDLNHLAAENGQDSHEALAEGRLVKLHSAVQSSSNAKDQVLLAVTSVNTEMSNVSRWRGCPSQWCRECCASESVFSSSSKFKCILKDPSELPTGRTCTGLSKRNSQPHQSKVDCEFTSLESMWSPDQLLGKCSKASKCCCPRSQLASLKNVRPVKSSVHPNQFCVSQETAEAWGDLKEFKYSNGMTETFMSVGNAYDVSNINLCGFFWRPGPAADQGERGARYSRIVFLSGGRYLTDLSGLVKVGSDYECPDDQIESRKEPRLICSC